MTIGEWLTTAQKKLIEIGVPTARLDAIVLLCYVMKKDKSYLLAHDDSTLTIDELAKLTTVLHQRLQRKPIAYIIGSKEFYGRDFAVTYDVLIPRPESENFIDALKKYPPQSGQSLLDIGTGSGILAITAKKEFPALTVWATDISGKALAVAKQNAHAHSASIHFVESDLLANIQDQFDYVFANLPYVPPDYNVSPEVNTEPRIAIFANHNGLSILFQLAEQLGSYVKHGGQVYIESLLEQHNDISNYYSVYGFKLVHTFGLVQVFTKAAI